MEIRGILGRRHRFTGCALALALAAPVAGALADPAPPPASEEVIAAPPTLREDRARTLSLGKLTAVLEQTTLEEIRSAAGRGEVGQAGDASAFQRWLCFSRPGELIWLVSGELGGGTVLERVFAETVAESDPRITSCDALPDALSPVSLEFGWLGSSEVDLRQRLGEPSASVGSWRHYLYEGKRPAPLPGTQPEQVVLYDVIAYVEAKIEASKVTALRVVHMTTY